jgi:hypothetical protein
MMIDRIAAALKLMSMLNPWDSAGNENL